MLQERADDALHKERSGFLLFWNIATNVHLREKALGLRNFIDHLPQFDRGLIGQMFFVLLNSRLTGPIHANYASTAARQLLCDRSLKGLLEIYAEIMRNVVDQSGVHRPEAKEYERLAYGGSIGIARLVFEKHDVLNAEEFFRRFVALRHDTRVRDLADRVRDIDRLLRTGQRADAIHELSLEAMSAQKGICDRLGLKAGNRGINVSSQLPRDQITAAMSVGGLHDALVGHHIGTTLRVGLITKLLTI